MPNDLLKSADATREYGYSRGSLLRFEDEGLLNPVRPNGTGQRRYPREQLEKLAHPVSKALDPNVAKPLGRPDYDELGTTGLRYSGGRVVEERLRELQGREGRILLREIRQNDPVITAVFFALTASLRQAGKRVKPASEKPADIECARYIEQCLDDMDLTWNDTFTLIVEPLFEQGFALLELCYKRQLGEEPPAMRDAQGKMGRLPSSKYKSSRIAWWKWSPRSAFSLAPGAEWIIDAKGNILGINQQPEYYGNYFRPLVPSRDFNNQSPITQTAGVYSIPIEKLLHFRTTVYPDGTPEGMPIHRAAYLPWYYTNNLQEIEGIGAERDLGGIPIIYMGNDLTKSNDPNSDWSLAKDLVTNVRLDEQMGIVFPGPKMGKAGEGNGWLFELASTQGRRQWNISEIIERYDKRKALVVLAQWIMLGMERVGSYALSQTQGDLFKLACKSWLLAIADVINRQGIQRLIRYNAFPGITGYPEIVFSDVGIPDLATVGEYINKLSDKGLITPDAELERHLRQIANLPQRPAEVKGPQVSTSGQPEVQKAEPVDRSALTDSGKKALDVTETLEHDLRQAWQGLMRNVADGMDTKAALAIYRRKAETLIADGLNETWLIGRSGNFTEEDEAELDRQIAAQYDYLKDFMAELETGLGQVKDRDEAGGLLLGSLSRAVLYAGAAWMLYNLASVWKQPQDSLWRWVGPVDSRTCDDCREEVRAGVRPLRAITNFPGSVRCLGNCRHELRRVK